MQDQILPVNLECGTGTVPYTAHGNFWTLYRKPDKSMVDQLWF